ncbi:MAG: hypothetical protein ACFB9M_17465 [Myxococcota bacterium]
MGPFDLTEFQSHVRELQSQLDRAGQAELASWGMRAGEQGLPISELIRCVLTAQTPVPSETLEIVADAHVLGALRRQRRQLMTEHVTPIIAAGRSVIAFLAGPPRREILDRDIPLLLQQGIGRRSTSVVLDVSCVNPLDDLLLHTLAGYAKLELPSPPFRLVSGVEPESEFCLRCSKLAGRKVDFIRHVGAILTRHNFDPSHDP